MTSAFPWRPQYTLYPAPMWMRNLDAETIVLKRRVSRSVATLRGLLPRPAKALTLQEMDAGVAAHLWRKLPARPPGQ